MKKLIPIIFVFVAVCLLILFVSKDKSPEPAVPQIVVPRTVIPETISKNTDAQDMNPYQDDENLLTSFIPLRSNETLISTLSTDFNNDGYDDQINAIKRSNSPYIILLIGIYNPRSTSYQRTAEINTDIIQVLTFSYTAMDVTGDHRNALIYSGTTSNGNTVMKIFRGVTRNGEFVLNTIGDFISDGTIFIQQLDRYDSYDQDLSQGASFPVWVYSSDGTPNSLDQLQTMYTWNAAVGKYIKQTETRVTGTKIVAEELNRILDGTVETFAEFLNGMWYKTSNTEEGIRYLFFDFDAKEIIFLLNDTEEVYTWVDSNIRRNGIYLSTINSSITNLTRRFDITLTDIDEIKLKIQDDVRMIISEGTLWDGQYKKLGQNPTQPAASPRIDIAVKIGNDDASWQTDDGTVVTFGKGTYTASNETRSDQGQMSFMVIRDREIIQFKSDTKQAFFDGAYLISYHESQDETENTTIELEPVSISPINYIPLQTHKIRLTQQRFTSEGDISQESQNTADAS